MAWSPAAAIGQAPTLCQITDTVYRADGSPAQGTALISWPAFTTAAGQAVTPGSLTVTLDASGGFNASLAPNTGASPAGTYYRAIFKLNDGTTDSEYWVVPNAATTTIGAIRSKLVPTNTAAQFLTRDYADATYVALASTQTISGAKTFSTSPAVPTPQNPTDAANKAYVDANAGSGNLASPPPIGNVAPNTGNFTTLTAQNSNGVSNPGNFPQSDPCAKINAAIASLPSAGGTIDARGFAPRQTCATTINASVPVKILFGAGTWTLGGDPGIKVTAPNVVIECPASTILQASSAILMSGGPNQLISNTVDPGLVGPHTADGTSVIGCELNGNAQGTFGIFAPNSYSMKIHGVHAKNFTGADILALAGQDDIQNTVADSSAGDGFVLGYDGHVSGMSQANGNSGDGWHVMAGGFAFDGPTGYRNGLHGMHFDGNQGGDWVASATYLEPKIVIPTSNNSGNYAFYTQQVGTSGATRPAFCQTVGCVVTTDGSVRWVNVGALNAYGFGVAEVFVQGNNNINSPNISQSNFGNHAGDWDNILIEGTGSNYSIGSSVLGAKVRQVEVPSTPAHGVHLKFASITSLKDTQWQGGAWTGTPQVELGGVELEHSYFTEIGFLSCLRSYGNCLSLVGSAETTIDKLVAQDGGVSGDPTTYALSMDANSGYTLIASLLSSDDRTPPFQSGISNAAAPANLVVKNRKYIGLSSLDSGNMYVDEALGVNGTLFYDVPTSAGFQWSVNKVGVAGFNQFGVQWFSPTDNNNSITMGAPSAPFPAYSMTLPTTPGTSGQCLTSSGGGSAPMTWSASANLSSPPPIGNGTPNTINATALTFQNIPGVEFLASRYASIQAAINAAYNGGTVLGTVIDDRTSPYTGPGFILYDSVTLKLAATTYTITGTVTYNNGNNIVTAGIVVLPGARLIGASTSTNHGTIVTAGNALNADLIATSTVGTGIAAAAQWSHWGGFQDLRVIGNGAHQTAGNCFNIENMGETAFLRTIEVSGCYLDNILFTGASATASDIANITTNSAGRYGFNFNNLSGVAVVHGLSGDSNATSIVRLNGGQSGTLTIVGFKTEEEISGQDPLITIDQTGQNGAQPSLYIVGGYTFGRSGVNDVIKYVNGTTGTTPYISVTNFYVQDYVNAVNDVVNSRSTAAVNMNKVPFYYGPIGGFLSGQAFTLDLNTFIQSPHSGNGILTEVFGTTSSNETMVAASGTSTDLSVGGIGFRMANRTTYGQSPELFAKMTYAFPGGIPNTQQWEFIPAKVGGDNSTRWLGDPSYRWDEVYAADVNTTTATVGTLNVTTCNGCGIGTRLVSGTMQGATSTLTGNSADQAIYTATLPAGTFTVGAGAHCYAKWTHPTASGAITYKWMLGTTTWTYGAYTSSSQNVASDIEVLTISSLSSQSANLSPVIAGTAIGIGGSYGNAGSENLANADTIKLTFNAGSSDQVRGATFYCQTVQ